LKQTNLKGKDNLNEIKHLRDCVPKRALPAPTSLPAFEPTNQHGKPKSLRGKCSIELT